MASSRLLKTRSTAVRSAGAILVPLPATRCTMCNRSLPASRGCSKGCKVCDHIESAWPTEKNHWLKAALRSVGVWRVPSAIPFATAHGR